MRFRLLLGVLSAMALLLILGVVSGVAQRWVVDIGDQSWVAILFSVAAFTLIPAFGWVLDHEP